MTDPLPGPAYRIITPRLVLRPYDPQDAWRLKEAVDANRPHLLPWMPWAAGDPEPLDSHLDRIRRWRGNFDNDVEFVYAVFSLDESQVLGGTGLHTRVGDQAMEIGYWVDYRYRRQGLATELSAALTRAAFEIHRVQRVEIHCDPDNHASAAVPRKLGFTHEATLRGRAQNYLGEWTDSMLWTLQRGEYEASPAAQAQMEAYDGAGRRLI
jgi:RimJ/RimL family protein N-acetyltransferase